MWNFFCRAHLDCTPKKEQIFIFPLVPKSFVFSRLVPFFSWSSFDGRSRHRKEMSSGLKDYDKQFNKLKRVKKQRADLEEMEHKNEIPKQWLPIKQKRQKRNSRRSQSRKRKRSKEKNQKKRPRPKPSSKKWIVIYPMWFFKEKNIDWSKLCIMKKGTRWSISIIGETKTFLILGV